MRGEGGLGLVEFKRRWETEGNTNEQVKKYSLGMDNLQAAVDVVLELLGMAPCENSGQVPGKAERILAQCIFHLSANDDNNSNYRLESLNPDG